jgi:hypothetical protein
LHHGVQPLQSVAQSGYLGPLDGRHRQDGNVQMIDSSIVREHQHASGPPKKVEIGEAGRPYH